MRGNSSAVGRRSEIEGLYTQLQTSKDLGLVKVTPAHLDALGHRMLSNGAHSSSCVVFVIGGEALPRLVRLWRRLQPKVRLVNEYGPTETVVGCVVFDVPQKLPASQSVPIGRPISNARVYILGESLQPAPVGVAGAISAGPGWGEGI